MNTKYWWGIGGVLVGMFVVPKIRVWFPSIPGLGR